jgi:hypothetical protein
VNLRLRGIELDFQTPILRRRQMGTGNDEDGNERTNAASAKDNKKVN